MVNLFYPKHGESNFQMFLFVTILPADYTVDKKNHTTVTTVFPKIGKMSRLVTSVCVDQCFTVCHVACVCEQEVQVWRPRFFWGLCWSACSSFSPWLRSSTSNAPTVSRTSSTAATKVNTWTLTRHRRSSFRPVALLLPPGSRHALFPHGWFDCPLEKLEV